MYESRFRHYGERVAVGKNAAHLDWVTEMYEHDTYDDFWKARSFLRRAHEITIPTLHGGAWYDHFIRGTLTSHEAIDAPKRLFVAPGSLATRTDPRRRRAGRPPRGVVRPLLAGRRPRRGGRTTGASSHETPAALEHGRVYCFDIEVWPIANLFRRGHRIRVDVSTSDFPFFESNAHRSVNQIFHDATLPSRLVLPVVTRGPQ